jgi:hypothetical protein
VEMKKPQRRRDELERLGEKPAEITPAEELQEAADLLLQQEPGPPAPERAPQQGSPASLSTDYVDPGLIDPAD